MAILSSADRIRAAVAAAAERLAGAGTPAIEPSAPAPGDLYVFESGPDVGLEWLVVRAHPDDPGLVLLAPADDFPLLGTPDIDLTPHVGRAMAVRCGETDWIPAGYCAPKLRVGRIPADALALVRKRLADLARGRPLASRDPSVDFDPEYEAWVEEVGQARQALVARAERPSRAVAEVIPLSRFRPESPRGFAPTADYALAAESGGGLLADLGKALAASGDVTYHEVEGLAGGRLVLVADLSGVRPVWEGAAGEAPRLGGTDASGGELVAGWRTGPEKRLLSSSVLFPWVDARVVLQIGSDPGRTVSVEL